MGINTSETTAFSRNLAIRHRHPFALLAKSDRGLLWRNSLFMFWLALVPFPTALLGDYPSQRVAVIVYGAVMAMAGVSFSSMRFYAFYDGKLTAAGIDPVLLRRAMLKSAMNPLLHFVAVRLAWVNTKIALVLHVGIPILFFLPSKLERSTTAEDRTKETL
ncbi:MAG TPA: hypothetical protein VKB88_23905 [Bryobacteraceae bacterium]|nr:hypothetical protein [Bryobacteraceae bacterium]